MHMFTYICAFMDVCLVVFIVIQWYRLANVCIPGMLLACRSNVFCVNIASTDARDAFSSSEITFYTDGFTLKTPCPASQLNISASLCWMQHKHLCTPVLNSTLEKKDGLVSIAASMMNICGGKKDFFFCLVFKDQFWLFSRNMTLLQWTNTLRCVCRWEAPRCVDWKQAPLPAVYSQMLIRFYSFLYKAYATSLALLQQVSGWMWDGGILLTALISLRLFVCFPLCTQSSFLSPTDTPSWEVSIGPGRQMIMVHVNSFSPATFSSQLCVLTERECTAVGEAHSVTMVGKKICIFNTD